MDILDLVRPKQCSTVSLTLWSETLMEILIDDIEHNKPEARVRSTVHMLHSKRIAPQKIVRRIRDILGDSGVEKLRAILHTNKQNTCYCPVNQLIQVIKEGIMKHQNLKLILLLLSLFLTSEHLLAAKILQPVGKITRIQGSAIENPVLLTQRDLTLNAPVHQGSEIKTGDNARLEITFNDGSKMVLGEWASIKLKDFKFTNDKNIFNDKQDIDIITGTFRFITGLIGKTNRYKVSLNTPVATIGIRGTDIFGGPLAAGMPPGEIHYGFMSISGAIYVVNRHGLITLDEPNEGTFLPMTGNKAPTPPNVWKQPAIEEAYASIEFN